MKEFIQTEVAGLKEIYILSCMLLLGVLHVLA
jgi:hypothetical protein